MVRAEISRRIMNTKLLTVVCNKSANKLVVIQQKRQQNGHLPTKASTNIEGDLTNVLIQ